MPASDPPILFATAARGTEGAVRDELRELGFRGVRADRGGVHFGRSLDEGFRATLELRTALRVLLRLASFDAPSEDALYDGVQGVDWSPFLTPRHTLAVRSFCRGSRLTHTQYIAQKTKDAVVDQLRARTGARPSVDRDDPDVDLFVHLVDDHATIYADLSGGSLHKRGWRSHPGKAPLKESLAAAVLRLSGWDRASPLVDPMCGSGTLAIEAALWARRVSPGLQRGRFGFERWASHDAAASRRVSDLRAEARARVLTDAPPIAGSDIDPDALAGAEKNAAAAGVSVRWSRASLTSLTSSHPPATVVTNPPYGERVAVGEDVAAGLAHVATLPGHRVVVLAGAPSTVQRIRIRPSKTLVVMNGDIECRLLTYDVPA